MLFIAFCWSKYFLACYLGGSASHGRPMELFLKELYDRGHTVAFCSTEENQKQITLVPYRSLGPSPISSDVMKRAIERDSAEDLVTGFKEEKRNYFDLFYDYGYTGISTLINDQRPDLILCDILADGCIDAAYENNVEYAISSFIIGLGGLYDYPYTPSLLSPTLLRDMGFIDRFLKTWYYFPQLLAVYYPLIHSLNQERIRMGLSIVNSPAERLENKLMLLNTLPGLEYNVELPPTIGQLGPVLPPITDTLDSKVSNWLDKQDKVAYMAFGSMSYLFPKQLKALFEGLRCTGLSVLFASKFFNITDYNQGDLKDVYHVKWAQQRLILKNDKVVLFVSHGGIESMHESIEAIVPLLIKPFFGDQILNARKIKNARIGDFIADKYAFTSTDICTMTNTLLNDIETTVNLYKLHDLLMLKAKTNIQEAADYLEYVADHGTAMITTTYQSLGLLARGNYDVLILGYMILILSLVFVGFISYKVVKLGCHLIAKKPKQE